MKICGSRKPLICRIKIPCELIIWIYLFFKGESNFYFNKMFVFFYLVVSTIRFFQIVCVVLTSLLLFRAPHIENHCCKRTFLLFLPEWLAVVLNICFILITDVSILLNIKIYDKIIVPGYRAVVSFIKYPARRFCLNCGRFSVVHWPNTGGREDHSF